MAHTHNPCRPAGLTAEKAAAEASIATLTSELQALQAASELQAQQLLQTETALSQARQQLEELQSSGEAVASSLQEVQAELQQLQEEQVCAHELAAPRAQPSTNLLLSPHFWSACALAQCEHGPQPLNCLLWPPASHQDSCPSLPTTMPLPVAGGAQDRHCQQDGGPGCS
jgi:hypothetical protein